MKTKFLPALIALSLSLGLSAASFSALGATDWTRNLSTGATSGSAPTLNAADGMKGYAANSNTSALSEMSLYNWGSGSGWGMYSDGESTSPQHALDNNDSNTTNTLAGNSNRYLESLVLHFNSAVKLTQLTIGWPNTPSTNPDTDVTVLAYQGGGTPISGTSTYGNLLNNGWKLVGQYGNLDGDVAANINAGGVTASYWMIAAYNSVFGGTCTNITNVNGCDGGNDYVKVLAVGGATTNGGGGQVPEPSPMALIGAALIGVVALRRRQIRDAA